MIRRTLMAAMLAALPVAAAAQDRPVVAVAETPARDVVVTGVRLKDSEAALRDCIARHCPPNEDIDATLGHAENLFVAGDYHAARRTLLSGIARDRRYARRFPVAVADLLRANARIAAHLGEGDSYLFSASDVIRALKAGLPDDDYRVLGAQIELADGLARSRRIDEALDTYQRIAARADRLGLTGVEGYARLRRVALLCALADAHVGSYADDARKSLDALIAEPDPRLAAFAFAARVLKAQSAARNGKNAAIEQLVADYRRMSGGSIKPMLLYSPPIQQNLAQAARQFGGGETINQMAMDDFDDQWVDISFWVAPDGRVTDPGILRQSSKLQGYWVKPILQAIGGRRYAPLAMEAGQPGVLRVERYSFTSRWTRVTGSRMRQREPIPQIEMIDLTVDPPSGDKGATAG
ncbi:hypothetical protein BH10PSE14_BH10PSE14_44820 [soil metagenome]